MYGKGFQFLSVLNLLGNFVLFMPMGMLLPCVFKGLDRFWRAILCIFIMVVGVEVMQFVLRAGVIDIDDVIFNISGAMIGYGIIKIPFIYKLLQRFYLIEKAEKQ
jgi:glycopeptide antibiotics resistance protein